MRNKKSCTSLLVRFRNFLILFSFCFRKSNITQRSYVRMQFIAKDVANWSKVIYVKRWLVLLDVYFEFLMNFRSAMRHRQINKNEQNIFLEIFWVRTWERSLYVPQFLQQYLSSMWKYFHLSCMHSNCDERGCWSRRRRPRRVQNIHNTYMQRQWHISWRKSVIKWATTPRWYVRTPEWMTHTNECTERRNGVAYEAHFWKHHHFLSNVSRFFKFCVMFFFSFFLSCNTMRQMPMPMPIYFLSSQFFNLSTYIIARWCECVNKRAHRYDHTRARSHIIALAFTL